MLKSKSIILSAPLLAIGLMASQISFADDCGMTPYQRWKQAEWIEDAARDAKEEGKKIQEKKEYYRDLNRRW